MTGVTRHSLDALAKRLGIMMPAKQNSEHFHFFVSGLFAEFCARNAESWWASIALCPSPGTSQTLSVLREKVGLGGLGGVHVGRFLELRDKKLFTASSCTGQGERAILWQQEMTGETAGYSCPVWGQLLADLSTKAAASLEPFVKEHLGVAAARWISTHVPAELGDSWDNCSMHEHISCDVYKQEHQESRTSKANTRLPTADDVWRRKYATAFPKGGRSKCKTGQVHCFALSSC